MPSGYTGVNAKKLVSVIYRFTQEVCFSAMSHMMTTILLMESIPDITVLFYSRNARIF
jgi:hypothetical protein